MEIAFGEHALSYIEKTKMKWLFVHGIVQL